MTTPPRLSTEGSSRRRVQLQADGGPLTPALHSRWTGNGNGARTADDRRLRDDSLEARSLDGLTSSLSEVESVDLPKTIVELQMQEVACKAALGATARVLQPSLLDFLR